VSFKKHANTIEPLDIASEMFFVAV